MDPLGIALSGMQSATLRFAASAHNVANLNTPAFRPLRADAFSLPGGGSGVHVRQEASPREVDLAGEIVDQLLAKTQLLASARGVAVYAETQGRLLDLFA